LWIITLKHRPPNFSLAFIADLALLDGLCYCITFEDQLFIYCVCFSNGQFYGPMRINYLPCFVYLFLLHLLKWKKLMCIIEIWTTWPFLKMTNKGDNTTHAFLTYGFIKLELLKEIVGAIKKNTVTQTTLALEFVRSTGFLSFYELVIWSIVFKNRYLPVQDSLKNLPNAFLQHDMGKMLANNALEVFSLIDSKLKIKRPFSWTFHSDLLVPMRIGITGMCITLKTKILLPGSGRKLLLKKLFSSIIWNDVCLRM